MEPCVSTDARSSRRTPATAARARDRACIESFNGKLRDECLNSHCFASIADAQAVLDASREDYNRVRPHSASRDRTPSNQGSDALYLA
jgi:putative transposase